MTMSSPIIHDIRHSKVDNTSLPDLRSRIVDGLSQPRDKRYLPSELLYDTKDLEIYDKEKEILERHGNQIATELSRDENGRAVIIELGAGSLEKTSLILRSIAQQISPADDIPPVTYYALDIDYSSLVRSLTDAQLHVGSTLRNKVAMEGLWGTFDDAFELLRSDTRDVEDLKFLSQFSSQTPVHMLFLGTTIGSFLKGTEDILFLKKVKASLNRERGDRFILAVDRAKPKDIMEAAYGAHFTPWIMNGLVSAGRALGDESIFNGDTMWERWTIYNADTERIEHGYKSTTDQVITVPEKDAGKALRIEVQKDEIVNVLISNKYKNDDIKNTVEQADLEISKRWADIKEWYYLFSLKSRD